MLFVGTGVSPVGLCRAIRHGQDAHATCATDNRQMRPQRPALDWLAAGTRPSSAWDVGGKAEAAMAAKRIGSDIAAGISATATLRVTGQTAQPIGFVRVRRGLKLQSLTGKDAISVTIQPMTPSARA